MIDIATFVGGSGELMAVIYEAEDKSFYKVNYGTPQNPYSFSKVFTSESAAEQFAIEFINKGNKPVLLEE
jgi:hypothetical protein